MENVVGVDADIRKATKRRIDEIPVDDHLFSLDVIVLFINLFCLFFLSKIC